MPKVRLLLALGSQGRNFSAVDTYVRWLTGIDVGGGGFVKVVENVRQHVAANLHTIFCAYDKEHAEGKSHVEWFLPQADIAIEAVRDDAAARVLREMRGRDDWRNMNIADLAYAVVEAVLGSPESTVDGREQTQ
jgi:hypothetical protein